jgi:hypothetical protein
MSGEVQTVRAAFDAFDRRDPEALARLFDPRRRARHRGAASAGGP